MPKCRHGSDCTIHNCRFDHKGQIQTRSFLNFNMNNVPPDRGYNVENTCMRKEIESMVQKQIEAEVARKFQETANQIPKYPSNNHSLAQVSPQFPHQMNHRQNFNNNRMWKNQEGLIQINNNNMPQNIAEPHIINHQNIQYPKPTSTQTQTAVEHQQIHQNPPAIHQKHYMYPMQTTQLTAPNTAPHVYQNWRPQIMDYHPIYQAQSISRTS